MSRLVRPGWVPDDGVPGEVECEWPGCDRVNAQDGKFGWLCKEHTGEAYEEQWADDARVMAKEDEAWPDLRN